ncbi:MAG: YfhO family protein [Flavobacteriales bacterium]|jgi:hypothetical protein|nr:YfhO family protein [Flavobacteriales bacterium]
MNPGAIDQGADAWARRWGWLLIAVAVLLAYWPLSSFQWTLTHGDTLNCWLPWRWFIASSLHNGQFPLWNPHQQFGYPMHADLQGPSWYVEAIALGGTIGHGIHVLQALFLLYVMIGGWGVMRLIRNLHGDARAGSLVGLAYALGGFFTGHQQHFYAVISAAWLPWMLDAFLRLMQEPGWRPAARVSLFQGLLLTGGNHTFTIIGAYLLAAVFALQAWRTWRADGSRALGPLLLWSMAAAIGSAVVGAGALHAWIDAGPHLARSGPLAYGIAIQGSVTWPALTSLLFPFAVGADQARIGADPSMANHYMGLIALVLAAASLLRRRTAIENLLLITGLLCGLIAAGPATPIHRWAFDLVPGFDLFRFPSYFMVFSWLAAMILAGGTITAMLKGGLSHRHLSWPIGAALLAAAVLCAFAMTRMGADETGISLFERMRGMHMSKRLLIGASVTLPALVATLVLAWRRRLGFAALITLVGIEMAWNSSLAVWNTAVSDMPPQWLHRRLSALSEGPVIPDGRPVGFDDDTRNKLIYLGHATQDYLGGFSRDGVNSFWLRNAMDLEVVHTALWEAMARQPLAYLADSIIAFDMYRKGDVTAARDSGLAVLMPGHAKTNAQRRTGRDMATVTAFDRNTFTITCSTAGPRMLVLQQSHYPGWEASVDGSPSALLNVNIAAMAVEVPLGEHTVEFRYRKPLVPLLLALSLSGFFVLLFALSLAHRLSLAGAGALAGMVCWSLFAHAPKKDRLPSAVENMLASAPQGARVIVHDDGHCRDVMAQSEKEVASVRASEITDVPELKDLLASSSTLHWIDAGLKADPAVRAALLDRYEAHVLDHDEGAMHVELKARASAPPWRLLHAEEGDSRTLTKDQPFGPGHEFDLAPLKEVRHGTLLLDAMAAGPGARAVFVVERKKGDLTTAYIAQPMLVPSTVHGAVPVYAAIPMEELWRADERLKVYTWSHQGDSISIGAFRIRIADQRFDRW